MLLLLLVFALGAMIAPFLLQRGRLGFLILALIPASAFCYLLTLHDTALSGASKPTAAARYYTENLPWAPELGFEISFRIDSLSWVMGLIVTGVGALVLAYCSRYFSASARGLGRFAGIFTAFSGAMLGLVTTDNTLALYLFWELTTVFSFLLIGHYFDKSASRRAAMQAIMVTTAGGLCMLFGIIIFGQAPGGSYSISELVAHAQDGTLGLAAIPANSTPPAVITAALILILLGAFSKSALIPLHFWLPAAMAAPTPVSSYLHAAAMVKAGIYLVARLSPGFAPTNPVWSAMILLFGSCTLLLGGYRALKQYDLKLVLAFGTVSQLGLLMIMVGYGSNAMMLAGLAMLLAHAMFKAALFLSVGIIDWATGTRDLRQLTGLARKMPVLAISAMIAAASMAGLPPLAGFVAKEAALHALTSPGADLRATGTWIVIALGSALTVGYTLRFIWGAFANKAGVAEIEIKSRSWLMLLPVIILAAASLGFGLAYQAVEKVFTLHAQTLPGEAGHLAIWGGLTPALAITTAVIVLGVLIFIVRKTFVRIAEKRKFPITADGTYQKLISGLETLSGFATSFTQRGSLPAYLSTIFTFTLAVGTSALILGNLAVIKPVRGFDSLGQLAVAIVTALAALIGARARHRMKAVLLMGISGYGVALTYELYGAPDLALTQVLAETMTLVVFILVLRRLPAYFSNRPMRMTRWARIILAAVVGVAGAAIAWLAAGARVFAPISLAFPEEAYYYGYGSNIVNVTLVDIRAWDTFGEISVVVAAAIGVSSLLFIRDKKGRIDRFRNLADGSVKNANVWAKPGDQEIQRQSWNRRQAKEIAQTVRAPGRNMVWLAGTHTLAQQRRSVILEVGTRIIFHTLVMLSLYFLFAGHDYPGGGFAAGMTAGIALVLRYVAGGRYELGAAVPLHPGHLMGAGLVIAAVSAIVPMCFGGTIFQTAKFYLTLPALGELKIATAIFFDIGVYLVVVGLVLDILRSLGAEIDRHGELAGIESPETYDIVPERDVRRDQAEAELSTQRYVFEIPENSTSADHGQQYAEKMQEVR
ncbi:Na+/H+ antiporter subunit A [Arcanobacterium hippocoleae]|uniref:Multicomponent Na+:H+ antiporter subunit A n=1 Tax=Arcanobacterium hippocoleae TaxID=149017 RepID=A0ABU1T2S3_9ACTO|nr:Na+/H+ antiporter subunit A [Arcanobacterium hippocoleae]MDR6939659.1 multicomponent Na+:H+ antiporter subunit A [Arcanobacterium hippocoleae]